MLNYIASDNTAQLIKNICIEKNLLILYEQVGIINIRKYLKETKVNFNLIRYFIIEISCLDNSENEIIENIYNFTKLHEKIRIIILAQGFNNNSNLLNTLYDKGIYNIINSNDETNIRQDLIKCLSEEGIQKKDAEKFKKVLEIKQKKSKIYNITKSIKAAFLKPKEKIKQDEQNGTEIKPNKTIIQQSSGVYFFALILETVTSLITLICYVVVFFLTSIGITILLNQELRNMVFQIFGLK